MNKDWELSIGFIPGFIFGARSYEEQLRTNHVLYILCISLCLTIYKRRQR